MEQEFVYVKRRESLVTVQSWWGELGELGLRVAGFGGGGYVI